MMMRYICIIGALLGTITLNGYAQQAPPPKVSQLTLADCIKYAYAHQDSVVNAGLDVKSAEYKVKETIGTGLPQVSGSITFQDFLKPPATVGPNLDGIFTGGAINYNAPLVQFPFGAVKYNNTYSLSATQLLFSGTFIVGLQAVKTFKELSQRSLVRTKIQINVNVTKAYYQVLVSNEQLVLLDANIKPLKLQLEQITQQNKQGFVEAIDVDRLSVQYNDLVTNRENVARALILNYQMLKFQMGMPIEQDIELVDKLENINLDQQVSLGATDTSVYNNRIEYDLLQTNLKLNQLDVKSKKAAYLPTVSANGGFGEVYQENQFKYLYSHVYPDSYVGLSVNVPIFNGNQRTNQLRQSEISVQKAKNDLENVKNALSLEASGARITFYNSIQSLKNQRHSRELAKEVLRVSTIKYQQGVGSSIEVTQAQSQLENADNQYIQALYNALISKVDLDKAYGQIK